MAELWKKSYPMFTKHKCFQTKVFENFLSKRREGETIATSNLYIPSTYYKHFINTIDCNYLAYFDPKKYTFKTKLTVFSLIC